MIEILIRGEGVAAGACAALLNTSDCRVVWEHASRPRIPAVLLHDSVITLIEDVCGRKLAIGGLQPVRKRIVAWGGRKPRVLEHTGFVVSEDRLVDAFSSARSSEASDRCDWTIHTSSSLPSEAMERRFGSRMATVALVKIKRTSPDDACWIESHEEGWLFLMPAGDRTGWLISGGAACVATALEGSRLIAEQIEEIGESAGQFSASPRLKSPCCGPGWIACGTAVMGFDPLCGEGTAYAVREAILAAAVIRSSAKYADSGGLLRLYESRLIAGFERHLLLCRKFYASGHTDSWWQQQLEAIEQGLRWCESQLHPPEPLRYRLRGFELEAVA